jgi:two-component system, OmpR family, phosphate regulon sensor histidine kinase PhoR
MPQRIPIKDILDSLDIATLLLENERIVFANDAARHLLGAHIDDNDLRLAVRHPDAVALALSPSGGRVMLEGLSVPGSRWEMKCQPQPNGLRVLSFSDRSVAVSVARAHADFVANASHELRTPLAAVIGYVETMKDPKAGGDAVTRDRFLDIVGREARRMQALVEDLMSLSRIEALKHDAPRDPVDILAVGREIAAETAPRGRITVQCDAAKVMIAGDRSQMAQVIRNLAENAIKYGSPDTPVSIQIEAAQTGWVSVAVRNEGEGIGPEHLPRLTERFYRADASRSRELGGTGLGLSIVKHIVERHRGRFEITSRIGEGTTASFLLPLLSPDVS